MYTRVYYYCKYVYNIINCNIICVSLNITKQPVSRESQLKRKGLLYFILKKNSDSPEPFYSFRNGKFAPTSPSYNVYLYILIYYIGIQWLKDAVVCVNKTI